MSKRGGHLWIFLATPLLAKECRIYIHDVALRLGVPVKGSGLADGIEVFPKHDAIGSGEFGNAIRGPLGIHRGANRRFWFYGADYTLEDQIAYLNRLRKVTEEELRRFRSQCHSRTLGNPPWCQPALLVLRRGLHAGGPDRIPQPSAKSHRGRTAAVHRWQGKARAGCVTPDLVDALWLSRVS